MSSATPLIKQYLEIKNDFPAEFIFFQVGDFYELFFDDAKRASHLLSITLTKRGTYNDAEIPLCGVPVHTADNYVHKLVKMGHTVVICSQVEVAQLGKLVERKVTQVISPGSILHDTEVTTHNDNCMMFIMYQKDCCTILLYSIIDQTVEYFIFHESDIKKIIEKINDIIALYKPQECILENENSIFECIKNMGHHVRTFSYTTYFSFNNHIFDEEVQKFMTIFSLDSLFIPIIKFFIAYIKKYHQSIMLFETKVIKGSLDEYLYLGADTIKHLELVESSHQEIKEDAVNTLCDCIDKTQTFMGKRLLKKWLLRPLMSLEKIFERQEKIAYLHQYAHFIPQLQKTLLLIGDMSRLVGRCILLKASFRDYQKLTILLPLIKKIKELITDNVNSPYAHYTDDITLHEGLLVLLEKYINTSNFSLDVVLINDADEELKRLYKMIESQTQSIALYEREEQIKRNFDGISIKLTPLYGYVFEISKNNSFDIPSDYQRVQTLSNKERYINPELKKFEYELTHAQNAYNDRVNYLFNTIKNECVVQGKVLQKCAQALAEIDCLCGLAVHAIHNNWTRPLFTHEQDILDIRDAKHPVLSQSLGNKYIENSLHFSSCHKTMILTGPNMGGKSTYMRQNGHIVILAHMGSYVPARQYKSSLFDAIFTRIGASDNLHKGQSTFFIEMHETAHICNKATEKSLILLDEIGRGTSTYDGMALAASIVKFFHEDIKPFLICATHYHELYGLINEIPHECWYHMAVLKRDNDIPLLLYKLKHGVSLESMGIETAHFAGIPQKIITNAYTYKKTLEKEN